VDTPTSPTPKACCAWSFGRTTKPRTGDEERRRDRKVRYFIVKSEICDG